MYATAEQKWKKKYLAEKVRTSGLDKSLAKMKRNVRLAQESVDKKEVAKSKSGYTYRSFCVWI